MRLSIAVKDNNDDKIQHIRSNLRHEQHRQLPCNCQSITTLLSQYAQAVSADMKFSDNGQPMSRHPGTPVTVLRLPHTLQSKLYVAQSNSLFPGPSGPPGPALKLCEDRHFLALEVEALLH